MAGNRAGHVERQKRRDEALELLGKGYGISEATGVAAANWGCSRKAARKYIIGAHHELVADLEPADVHAITAALTARLERIARKAEQAGQYGAAVGACRSLYETLILPWHKLQQRNEWT
jgi:hypothetical protein